MAQYIRDINMIFLWGFPKILKWRCRTKSPWVSIPGWSHDVTVTVLLLTHSLWHQEIEHSKKSWEANHDWHKLPYEFEFMFPPSQPNWPWQSMANMWHMGWWPCSFSVEPLPWPKQPFGLVKEPSRPSSHWRGNMWSFQMFFIVFPCFPPRVEWL